MVQIGISETSLLSLSLNIENHSEQFKTGCKKIGQSLDIGSLGNLIHAITQMIINMEKCIHWRDI